MIALIGVLVFALVEAQTSTGIIASSSIITNPTPIVPTGPYLSFTPQVNLTTSTVASSVSFSGNASLTIATTATTSSLLLVGSRQTSTLSGNATATSTIAQPVNTQPCNGYVEFCNRQYSNITNVCSHNSAFIKANNAFANQNISIPGQLNDGIRMIQGETHYLNDEVYSCHTNCSFLNVGTYESELATVRSWLEAHPFDVVTILIVNSDYINVNNYTAPFVNSGLIDYVYHPPKSPMTISDWPTLGEMILSGKRVVVFMDYQANQTAVPYILDEFTQMWETPFSPTNISFPCTEQRPPGVTQLQLSQTLYLANHNLNIELDILSLSALIPNTANLSEVNAVNGMAGLGTMGRKCEAQWGRPPNFLLVDFYNAGSGSVFQAAAEFNNVTYTGKCCGLNEAVSGAPALTKSRTLMIVAAVAMGLFVLA